MRERFETEDKTVIRKRGEPKADDNGKPKFDEPFKGESGENGDSIKVWHNPDPEALMDQRKREEKPKVVQKNPEGFRGNLQKAPNIKRINSSEFDAKGRKDLRSRQDALKRDRKRDIWV